MIDGSHLHWWYRLQLVVTIFHFMNGFWISLGQKSSLPKDNIKLKLRHNQYPSALASIRLQFEHIHLWNKFSANILCIYTKSRSQLGTNWWASPIPQYIFPMKLLKSSREGNYILSFKLIDLVQLISTALITKISFTIFHWFFRITAPEKLQKMQTNLYFAWNLRVSFPQRRSWPIFHFAALGLYINPRQNLADFSCS